MATLGIDIGANKIRFVVWEKEVLKEGEFKLGSQSRIEIKNIFQEIFQKTSDFKITSLGVGVPGTFQGGAVLTGLNLPEIVGWNIKQELEEVFKVSTTVVGDAQAFVVAEATVGAAQGKNQVVGLTLGSGLGTGLFLNGQLYLGNGKVGTVGREILNLETQEEAEDFSSEKFFKKLGQDPLELQEKAEAGDLEAQKIYNQFGQNLGVIIANLVNLLDPQVIVLGGGIARAYPLFIKSLKNTVIPLTSMPHREDIEIIPAKLGSSAGAIGAALLAG